MRAGQGDQYPGAQGHGRDMAGRVGTPDVRDRVREGGVRSGAVRGEGEDGLQGNAHGGDRQCQGEAAHATPEGEDGYSCDGDDDEEGVSDQREGLGHLAEVGARSKDGRVYVGVEDSGVPGQGQSAPEQEQQGEYRGQCGLGKVAGERVQCRRDTGHRRNLLTGSTRTRSLCPCYRD